jgi:Fibronectin type III domain/PASTA domain/Divergent InlB B-repeat domain
VEVTSKRFMHVKRWTGVSVIVAAMWTGAALGGVFVGDAPTAAPPNDDFANAIVLSGSIATRVGDTNVDATLETGEPGTVADGPAFKSVWYTWTAPANGQVVIDLATSSYETLLAAYTGSVVNALTEVASDDDFGVSSTSRIRFQAASGTVYKIRVDGYNGTTGTINLDLHQDPPPPNDNLASAVVLSGASTSRLDDTNEGATLEAGEDDSVAGTAGGASVWYMWTAPASGQTTIDTETSDLNTLLGVYTGGSVNALTEVAANDDWQTEFTSQVTFAATMGTVYWIRVDGGDADTGTINLHLHDVPPPPNDNFASAIVLSGASASRTDDTNTGATLEAGEPPTVAASPAGASIWYSWTAPDKGEVTIDTATSSFDTLLGIYTGSAVGSPSPVASNDDGGVLLTSRVTFPVTASTVYKVRVDGFLGDSGTVNLHLAFATVPGAPTGVTATAGPGQATVSWTAPASDGGSAIIGYVVTSFIGGVAQSTTSVGVVTQTIVAGLTNGTTYTFRVAALNGVGQGLQAADSNPVTPQKLNQTITVTNHAPATAALGTSFTVAATAPGGAVSFSSSGSCSNSGAVFTMTGAGGTCSVKYDQFGSATYNAAPQVTESVTAPRFTLTVSKSGTGSGTVTSGVGGLNCGATCSADFDARTSVTLTAAAASGSTFAGWSGACTGSGGCTVTMDAAKTVTAAFGLQATPPPPKPPVKCVVPNVRLKTLAAAKRKITAGRCRLGKVTKAKSKTVPKGKVISQSPKAGKKLARGAKVNLVLSRGKR